MEGSGYSFCGYEKKKKYDYPDRVLSLDCLSSLADMLLKG